MLTVFVSFLLSGLIGSAIAAGWQRKNWLFQQKREKAEKLFLSRRELVANLFGLLEERIYATRIYSRSIRDGDINVVEVERQKYREVVYRWNSKFPGYVIQMRADFSVVESNLFDIFFPKKFFETDSLLSRARKNITSGFSATFLLGQVDEILKEILLESNETSARLLDKSNQEKTFIESDPAISRENLDELSYAYLIKSLLKERRL